MTQLSLTRTVNGTTSDVDANLNNNWTELEDVVNDSLDNANIATGANVAVAKLAAGSNGQVLTTTGGVPVWTTTAAAGSFNCNLTAADSPENTSENDLQTITIGAAALTTGDVVLIQAAGTMSSTVGTRTISLKFGGTTLVSEAVPGGTTVTHWNFEAVVKVTGASAQSAVTRFWAGTAAAVAGAQVAQDTPAEAVSGSIVVKTTGITANTGDEITSMLLMTQILKA